MTPVLYGRPAFMWHECRECSKPGNLAQTSIPFIVSVSSVTSLHKPLPSPNSDQLSAPQFLSPLTFVSEMFFDGLSVGLHSSSLILPLVSAFYSSKSGFPFYYSALQCIEEEEMAQSTVVIRRHG